MIRKDKKTFKTGTKTHIRVVEGYRDENGKIKQRTIKSFGYLEEQTDQIKFMQDVEDFDKNFLLSKKDKKDSFKTLFYESTSNIPFNYGYRFLEAIYEKLQIKEFFDSKYNKTEYDLSEIFKFLVIQRIMNPDSKRATFQLKDTLYNGNYTFNLHHIYRALDKFNEYKIDLQKYINDKIKTIIGRDSSYAYYDVTNYYTEIDFPNDENDLRQKGVSKEHRLDPIIQMGLFMDNNGIPISMSLFKGNTSDTKTLQPVMKEIKENYNLNRLIVVADKGLNSSNNINYIVNNNDGYVVSQILKGKKGKRYQEELFKEESYIYNKDKTFKYKTFIEDYEIVGLNGKKAKKQRKVLIYWRLEDAILELRKREEKLKKALKSLKNNAYAIKHSYEEYISEIHSINETGEIADKTIRTVNEEKAAEDAKYDGYFCIITSELDYDYNKILEVYGGLWKIEESFRITKQDLEVRPIYVNKEARINGHFITCYVALILIRLMQYKINYKLSVERITKALNECNCIIEEDNTIKVLRNKNIISLENEKINYDEDETLKDYLMILDTFKIAAPYLRYKKENFKKFLEKIKY